MLSFFLFAYNKRISFFFFDFINLDEEKNFALRRNIVSSSYVVSFKVQNRQNVLGVLETHEESRLLVTRLHPDIWISVKCIFLLFCFVFFFI